MNDFSAIEVGVFMFLLASCFGNVKHFWGHVATIFLFLLGRWLYTRTGAKEPPAAG